MGYWEQEAKKKLRRLCSWEESSLAPTGNNKPKKKIEEDGVPGKNPSWFLLGTRSQKKKLRRKCSWEESSLVPTGNKEPEKKLRRLCSWEESSLVPTRNKEPKKK